MKKGKVKKEFKFNSADYDYMDDMSLEGWMWEFIRRSTEYGNIIKIDDCDKFMEIAGDICEVNLRVEAMSINDINKNKKNLIHIINDNSKYYLRLRDDKNDVITYTNDSGKEEVVEIFFKGLPFPKYRYIDFPDSLKPTIRGMKNIITCMSFEELKNTVNDYVSFCKATSKVIKTNPDAVFYEFTPKRIKEGKNKSFVIFQSLSPKPNFEDTVYIGISRKAKIKDIEKELISKIRKYLKKTKTRDDKWKYYLIAYDLKKEYPNLTYDEIADKLVEAYPFITIKNKKVDSPEYFTARNCENLYKSALELIEGSYKKYLI